MNCHLIFVITGVMVSTSTFIMTIWFLKNRILNFYLLFTTFVLCNYLVFHGLFDGIKNQKNYIWTLFDIYLLVLLCPAIHLHIKHLINDFKYAKKDDLIHFITPPLLLLLLINDSIYENKIIKTCFLIFLIIYSLFYLHISNKLIKKLRLKKIEFLHSKYDEIVYSWGPFIFYMMISGSAIIICMLIENELNFYKTCSPISDILFLIIFIIGYLKVMLTPELLYGFSKSKKDNIDYQIILNQIWIVEFNGDISNYKNKVLKHKISDNLLYYISKIETIAFKEHSFRLQGYSLYKLSLNTGIPKYHLDFIFKYHCKLNFYDFKRAVRIYDAIDLIKQGYLKTSTLNSLALLVGFSSYNPFLVNFKKITGKSPNEFSKKYDFSDMNMNLKINQITIV